MLEPRGFRRRAAPQHAMRGRRRLVHGWLVLMLCFAAISGLVIGAVGHVSAQALTFTPTADTYVDSSAPNTNYGSSQLLAVGGNQLNVGGGAGTIRQSFLKFSLSGISGPVASATLRLFVENQDAWGSSSTGGSVAAMTNTSWSETSITYNTRPTIDGAVLSSQGAVSAGQWYSWDVTAAVSGDGTISLALTSPDGDGAFYSSRESGADAPQLVVTLADSTATATPTNTATTTPTSTPTQAPTQTPTGTPTNTPTQTPTNTPTQTPTNTPTQTPTSTPTATPTATTTPPSSQSLTFTPTADTYVDSSAPNTNYGASTLLAVGGNQLNVGAGAGTIRQTFLKFNLSGLGSQIVSATLRLFVETQDQWGASSTGGSVAAISNSSWSETSVTYNSRPTIDGAVLSSQGAVASGQWYSWDVTAAVTGNGVVSLGVTSPDGDGAFYSSRESGANAPQLIVSFSGSGSSGTPTPTPTTTPTSTPTPPSSGDPVVAAAGDVACDPSDGNYKNGAGVSYACQQKATSDLLVNKGYAAVFALGDEQYESGTLSAFQQSYDPTWGRVKSITYPAAGNHEYGNGSATGYFQYFGARAGSPTQGYYSFNLGAWHVIVLNSNCNEVGGCDAGSPQEQWLQQDLSANPGVCTLAYFHHPRFNSGYGGSNPAFDAFRQDLYAAGADAVLNGHSHTYERFAPQDPNGNADPTNGITEFVVGTGGESFSDFGTIAANSVVRQNNTFGVLQLTLHADSFSWQFVPIAGKSFTDSGTASCHHGGAPGQSASTVTSTATSTATVTSSPTPTKPGKKGKGH